MCKLEVSETSEKEIESLVRSFTETLFEKGDVESALSFITEDAVFVFPTGRTYKGKDEWRRLWTHVFKDARLKFRDKGNGVVVKGNTAFWERILEEVTSDGRKCAVSELCVHECINDKISEIRVFHDRLFMAYQLARGWLEKRVVGSVVNAIEKGLP